MRLLKRAIPAILGGLLIAWLHGRAHTADDAKADEIVVIVNEQSPLQDPLPPKRLKGVFVGDITYEKDVKLMPVNQKDPELMGAFLKRFVGGVSVGSYASAWVKRLLSEGGAGPVNAESAEEVVKIVSANKGAVGYLWRKDFSAEATGVRELRIAK